MGAVRGAVGGAEGARVGLCRELGVHDLYRAVEVPRDLDLRRQRRVEATATRREGGRTMQREGWRIALKRLRAAAAKKAR